MKFSITTLGCKVNQYESEELARGLTQSGGPAPEWAPAGAGACADVCIVNTCTVTSKAAMQSRRAIRQAIRSNPGARIVVTGCYAQTAPEEIDAIEGVDDIIGHAHKPGIAGLIRSDVGQAGGRRTEPNPPKVHRGHGQAPCPSSDRARTRPFLKIQDGCNACCTYCIVPSARGRSLSRPAEEVLTQINRLRRSGYKEVVLTGIHLGCYGRDLSPPTRLHDLVRAIREGRLIDRIRLSSIEPRELTDDIITLAALPDPGPPPTAGRNRGMICPHFHIPLQSGDDRILKAMGRPYSAETFSVLINDIHRKVPHAGIGADVLTGFPGEDQAAFENTLALIDRLPLTYLHVFPFSARKGTPAATYPNQVPIETVRRRSAEIRRLGQEKKEAFYRRFVGERLEVLVEADRDPHTGKLKGVTPNYLSIMLSGGDHLKNRLVEARLDALYKDPKGGIHGICQK